MRRTYGREARRGRPRVTCCSPLRYFVSVSARYSAFALVPVSSATTPAAGARPRPALVDQPRSAASAGPSGDLVDLGAADDEDDLAARPLLGVARGQLRGRRRARPPRRPSSARGRRPPAARDRPPPAPPATPRPAAATRRPRPPPASAGPPPARPSCAAGSPRSATSRPPCPTPPARPAPRSGPGSTSTSSPAAMHACTSTRPGIADERHPGIADQRHHRAGAHPLDQPRRHAPLGVRVVAHALGRHPVAVEQHLRACACPRRR